MTQILLRRGTATEWATLDPVLGLGEAGYDTTNNELRVGDGTSHWSALVALVGSNPTLTGAQIITAISGAGGLPAGNVSGLAEAAQDAVAAALVGGANITIVYNDAADTITVTVTGLSSTNISDFRRLRPDRHLQRHVEHARARRQRRRVDARG
jgi:hypothetical protein